MADKAWKAFERVAAALFGAKRYPANTGGPVDFAGNGFVGQCKNVARMSLAELESLAITIQGEANALRNWPIGVVVVKRRAGKGIKTPALIVMTDREWRMVMKQLGKQVDYSVLNEEPVE